MILRPLVDIPTQVLETAWRALNSATLRRHAVQSVIIEIIGGERIEVDPESVEEELSQRTPDDAVVH